MIYYPIKGTLNETSEAASPYSYFSLTRRYGLREMWDDEHAAFYGKEKKHDVADYIKPLGICVDNGGTAFVRCCIMDSLGIERIADIQSSVAQQDPEFVANVLKALFGFNVYSNLYSVFARALNVQRMEPEETSSDSSGTDTDSASYSGVTVYQTIDGYPLTGGILYDTNEYNYIEFYHIVDPLTMNDGKPAYPSTSEDSTEESGESGESSDGESSDSSDGDGDGDGEAGDGAAGSGSEDGAEDSSASIPQPEIVIHAGYGVKLFKGGFSSQLSEEEE